MAQLNPSLFHFLKTLKENNNRNWFLNNKRVYEKTKNEFALFIEELIQEIKKFDKTIVDIGAKECMFRINRDVRFSNDKSPYKTNIGAGVSKGGKKLFTGGYYLHLEPEKSFIAGGIYMPPTDILSAIRQEIDYNPLAFKTIVYNKSFVNHFRKLDDSDKLKTAPKGYAKDHLEIETLKLKSFIVSKSFSDKQICAPDFLQQCIDVCKAIKPLNAFLNKATD